LFESWSHACHVRSAKSEGLAVCKRVLFYESTSVR
jgi:hypothetical protein